MKLHIYYVNVYIQFCEYTQHNTANTKREERSTHARTMVKVKKNIDNLSELMKKFLFLRNIKRKNIRKDYDGNLSNSIPLLPSTPFFFVFVVCWTFLYVRMYFCCKSDGRFYFILFFCLKDICTFTVHKHNMYNKTLDC